MLIYVIMGCFIFFFIHFIHCIVHVYILYIDYCGKGCKPSAGRDERAEDRVSRAVKLFCTVQEGIVSLHIFPSHRKHNAKSES